MAYQDSDDDTLFYYIPTDVETILGDTLEEFKVTYWGIGQPFLVRKGKWLLSVVGASLEGSAVLDISSYQRARIIEAIQAAYRVQNPTLKPMHLDNVVVQPVVGENTLQLGEDGEVKFPKRIHFGVPFHFSVSTGNSLFAAFVGAQAAGDVVITNPAFGVLICGDAQFQGPPWQAVATTDLSKVWSFTRRQFEIGIKFSWLEIPLASFQTIIVRMVSDGTISLDFSAGSMDPEIYGRAILEMGKRIFEAVNALGLSDEGFFSFETKKWPPHSLQPSSGLSWPWKIFLNAAYTDRSIPESPACLYREEISYVGLQMIPVSASMTLAVACNSATAQLYRDLGDIDEPCITAQKSELMQQRMQQERADKQSQADEIYERWILGEINDVEYHEQMNMLYRISSKEDKLLA
ncbi:MAG: hypothetical protein WAT66_09065 [Actinomycetota bacterium]